MKGKIGLVVGLGAGYVLGTRAGRERYEQIKHQWLKVWNLDPVQAQVTKVTSFAKAQAAAVPGVLWDGAVKIVKSASGSGTPGQKLDSAISTSKQVADDASDVVEDAIDDAKARAKAAAKDVARKAAEKAESKPAAKKPAVKKPAAKKSTTTSNGE